MTAAPPRTTARAETGDRRIPRRTGVPGTRAAVGALLVVGATLAVFLAYRDATSPPRTSFAVARTDLRPGVPIRAGDLRLQPMEVPPGMAAAAFGSVEELVGRHPLGPVAAGEVVQAGTVSREVPAEMGSEVSLALPRANVAADRLAPGDLVDLYATVEGTTSTMASSCTVVDLAVSADAMSGGEVQLTIGVPGGDVVGRIVHALRTGEVTVVRSTFAEPASRRCATPAPTSPEADGEGQG
ncbi:MAG: SAF domain-containing protein [Acidimicrobiia bacterium]